VTAGYLHLPVAGFHTDPIEQEHEWSGRHVPWIDEIVGLSLHVQSWPGVQTHWLMNTAGQHHATELMGADVHPASKKRSALPMPGPEQLHAFGGSGAVHGYAPREHPVMHSAPASFETAESRPEPASISPAPLSEPGLEASVQKISVVEMSGGLSQKQVLHPHAHMLPLGYGPQLAAIDASSGGAESLSNPASWLPKAREGRPAQPSAPSANTANAAIRRTALIANDS
jgi:hypothetical protein